jgi:hypothetical protein
MYYLWLESVKTSVTELKRNIYLYGLFNDVTSLGYGDNLSHPSGYTSPDVGHPYLTFRFCKSVHHHTFK